MKTKIMLLLLGVCSCSSALAQTDSLKSNKQNHKHRWGIGLAINSFNGQLSSNSEAMWGKVNTNLINNSYGEKKDESISISIISKYYFQEDFRLRLEFGFSNVNLMHHYSYTDIALRQNTNQVINQKIYSTKPGLEWEFFNKKFISTFAGVTASYIRYGDLIYDYDIKVYRLPYDTLYNWASMHTVVKGGFSAGIGVITGLEFAICKFLSFGAEFSSDLMYYNIGGKYEEVGITYLPEPPTTETFKTNSKFQAFKFTRIQTSFILIVRF